MVLVMMGVTASGKTTIGEALAKRLEWVFADGDDYHSQANKEKMQDGIPLTDADRAPWLIALNGLLADWDENGISGVLACSALKQEYRDQLRAEIPAGDIHFIFLDAPRALIEERASLRHHAFATPALVESQLEILEPPADAVQIELENPDGVEKSVDEIVDEVLAKLHLKTGEEFRAKA
jgi:gluconokinase